MDEALEVDRRKNLLSLHGPGVIDIRGLKHGMSRILAALTNHAIFRLFGRLSTDPRNDGVLTRKQARTWLNEHQGRKSFIWIPSIHVPGIQIKGGIELKLHFERHFLSTRGYNSRYGDGEAEVVVANLRRGAPCGTSLYRPIKIDSMVE